MRAFWARRESWARTARTLAQNAVSLLRSTGADIAGVVLTQVDLERHARYGYDDISTCYVKYKHRYQN